MPPDLREMSIGLTVNTLTALNVALKSSVFKRVLKPKSQTHCVEFHAYAQLRLSQFGPGGDGYDNREVKFTLTVETGKSLVEAIDHYLSGPQIPGDIDRRCEEVKQYLNHTIEHLPSVPKQAEFQL